MILLDTSFFVGALVRDSPANLRLRGWLPEGELLATSAIACQVPLLPIGYLTAGIAHLMLRESQ